MAECILKHQPERSERECYLLEEATQSEQELPPVQLWDCEEIAKSAARVILPGPTRSTLMQQLQLPYCKSHRHFGAVNNHTHRRLYMKSQRKY